MPCSPEEENGFTVWWWRGGQVSNGAHFDDLVYVKLEFLSLILFE